MRVKCPEMRGIQREVGCTNQVVVGTHCSLACVSGRVLAKHSLVSREYSKGALLLADIPACCSSIVSSNPGAIGLDAAYVSKASK